MKILTDYLILPEQSAIWQERTDYLFERPSRIRKCSETMPGRFLKKICDRFDKSHFVNAARLFMLREEYDLIITGIFQVSEILGFLQYLFPGKRVPHIMIDFMLDEESTSLLWKLKVFFQGMAFRQADKILVFSREEERSYAKRFSMPVRKFLFLHYHTNVISPEYIPGEEPLIFSAGRSGRDYKTLVEAVRGTPCKLVIVCGKENLIGVDVPDNCQVYYDLPHEDYLSILKKAMLVVIPLGEFVRSMGLMVMLESMAYGKPIVITKGISNREYVNDAENAIFCKYNDPDDMKEKILSLLTDKTRRELIGKKALSDISEKWTFDTFVRNLFLVVNDVMQEKADT